jgi:hypothetical protein
MEQSPSWEANSLSAIKEITCLLWNPKFLYRVHKGPPLMPILRQMKPDHILLPYFPQFRSNIILQTYMFYVHEVSHSATEYSILHAPWCRTLFEKLRVTQPAKKYPVFFMKSKGSLPCSQSSPLDPILSQPNPVRPIDPYLPKVQLNVIFPPMARSSQWSLTFGPPNQNYVNTSPLPHVCHMSRSHQLP